MCRRSTDLGPVPPHGGGCAFVVRRQRTVRPQSLRRLDIPGGATHGWTETWPNGRRADPENPCGHLAHPARPCRHLWAGGGAGRLSGGGETGRPSAGLRERLAVASGGSGRRPDRAPGSRRRRAAAAVDARRGHLRRGSCAVGSAPVVPRFGPFSTKSTPTETPPSECTSARTRPRDLWNLRCHPPGRRKLRRSTASAAGRRSLRESTPNLCAESARGRSDGRSGRSPSGVGRPGSGPRGPEPRPAYRAPTAPSGR